MCTQVLVSVSRAGDPRMIRPHTLWCFAWSGYPRSIIKLFPKPCHAPPPPAMHDSMITDLVDCIIHSRSQDEETMLSLRVKGNYSRKVTFEICIEKMGSFPRKMDIKGIPHSVGNISKGVEIGQVHDDIWEMTVNSPTKPGLKIVKPCK